MKGYLSVKVVPTILSLLAIFPTTSPAPTNAWTKPTSGAWEEPYWSLGTLPSATQEVALWNPGWKAVAIGANTAANYPTSLRVNNLFIDAPTNSANRLLLNWAGHNVPLVVRTNVFIGTNGSMVAHFSALQTRHVELRGFAAFSDSARATVNEFTVGWGGALNLHDATLTCSNLAFFGGSVTQSMGVAVISTIAYKNPGYSRPRENVYVLSGGVLYSGVASIGYRGSSDGERFRFFQSGGAHSNTTMKLQGGPIERAGYYYLSGGLLVSDKVTITGGTMEQSGGTNLTRELVAEHSGYYSLSSGQLVTSNTTMSTVSIHQSGGTHTVQSRLTLEKGAEYRLSAGTLSAPVIEIRTSAGLASSGGEVSNSGMVVLRGGSMTVENGAGQFGKLQVLEIEGPGWGWGDGSSTLRMGWSNTPTIVRFEDSRDLPWTGTLQVRNWATNKRIFVGANSQALTSNQLKRVVFIRPSGLPSDYSGALTASGELVPGAVHDYDYVVTNGTVTITRYTGPGGNLTVPSTIENLPVTTIGTRAFYPDFFNTITALKIITLPDTVTEIGEEAFKNCKGLTNINLGNGVIRIGDRAFSDCDSLAAITLPASVREIGFQIFESCYNLVAITVHPDNPLFSSLDGVVFNKSQTRLIQFPLGRSGAYAVPETVRSIEYAAFYACSYLSNVTLSASVTNIGGWAFGSCIGLTNITIQEGVRTVGEYAFVYCHLTSITLPDSLTSIGHGAFHYTGLIRAEIGRGITSFDGWKFFAYSWNLAGVYFRGNAPQVLGDFDDDTNPHVPVTVYYLPGTAGWGATYAGRPTARWRPLILASGPHFGVRTNRFGFMISWPANALVVVEASTNLANPNWSAISTNALTAGSSYFSDPHWRNYPNRFYRLRVPQAR